MCVAGARPADCPPVLRATPHCDTLGLKLWTWNKGVGARARGLPCAAPCILLGSQSLETPGLARGGGALLLGSTFTGTVTAACLLPSQGLWGKWQKGSTSWVGWGGGGSFLWVSGTQHFHPQSAWSSDAPGSWLTELWGSAGSISCWRPRPPAPVALIKEGIMTPCSVELGSGAPKTDKALCSVSAPCGRAICTSTPVCGSAEDQGAQGGGGGPLGGVS